MNQRLIIQTSIESRFKESPLAELSASEIEPLHLQAILESLSGGTRNGYLRILKAVFNYAIKRDWSKSNPILKMDFAKLPKEAFESFRISKSKEC